MSTASYRRRPRASSPPPNSPEGGGIIVATYPFVFVPGEEARGAVEERALPSGPPLLPF